MVLTLHLSAGIQTVYVILPTPANTTPVILPLDMVTVLPTDIEVVAGTATSLTPDAVTTEAVPLATRDTTPE